MFPFIKNSKLWFTISGVLVTLSLIAIATLGLRLGIDFTGGSLLEISGLQEVENEQIAEQVALLGEEFESPVIQKTSEETVLIRTKFLTPELHDEVFNNLSTLGDNVEEQRFNTIGATVGEVMKEKAVTAIILAIVFIILYVAIAFSSIPAGLSSFKFGFAAVVALTHDIIITLGIFSVLGTMFNAEINAMFITAILTVLGFSVHDTIVVFDRFRENLMGNMKSTVPKLANEALNQTLARSLNTSITILITLLALLFFAGNSIFYFVLTLVIGTIIGTYSSIFLATPFLSKWIDHGLTVEEMMKKKKKEAGI